MLPIYADNCDKIVNLSYEIRISTIIRLYDNGLINTIDAPVSRRQDIRDILINPRGLDMSEDIVDYWLDDFEVY